MKLELELEMKLKLKLPPVPQAVPQVDACSHPRLTVTCSQAEDPAAVVSASSCGGNKNCSV